MAGVDLSRYKRMVQYFWDPEPTNNDNSKLPVWCLGREYALPLGPDGNELSLSGTQPKAPTPEKQKLSNENDQEAFEVIKSSELELGTSIRNDNAAHSDDGGWPHAFLDDFESKLWFSYRSGFPAIPKSQDPKATAAMSFSVRLRSQLTEQGGFTSDTGWGCMIRSGQSLLANAMLMLRLSRDWRWRANFSDERHIVSLFADDPQAPYSIHKFVEYGAEACGKHPGQWFGPSATARCIQQLTNQHDSSSLRVYITGDGSDVYRDDFMAIAKPHGASFRPTLILVGTRLGIDKITPVYWDALKATLQMPQSVGIAGGRPSSSHYFIGVQDSNFFYLDPHQTRAALPYYPNVDEYTDADISSCHTRRLRRLSIQEMDPSMLIGFLIRDEEDWDAWSTAVQKVPGKAIIHIADHAVGKTGTPHERRSAIDEVESFDEDDGEDDGDEGDDADTVLVKDDRGA